MNHACMDAEVTRLGARAVWHVSLQNERRFLQERRCTYGRALLRSEISIQAKHVREIRDQQCDGDHPYHGSLLREEKWSDSIPRVSRNVFDGREQLGMDSGERTVGGAQRSDSREAPPERGVPSR
jgi:hypothetical protein